MAFRPQHGDRMVGAQLLLPVSVRWWRFLRTWLQQSARLTASCAPAPIFSCNNVASVLRVDEHLSYKFLIFEAAPNVRSYIFRVDALERRPLCLPICL